MMLMNCRKFTNKNLCWRSKRNKYIKTRKRWENRLWLSKISRNSFMMFLVCSMERFHRLLLLINFSDSVWEEKRKLDEKIKKSKKISLISLMLLLFKKKINNKKIILKIGQVTKNLWFFVSTYLKYWRIKEKKKKKNSGTRIRTHDPLLAKL